MKRAANRLVTVPAVSAVSAAVVTSTAKTTMVSAVVERTVMVPAVMPTAVIPTVSKVAGADETVHDESDTGYRRLTLTAELLFSQDAPDGEDAARQEPHERRLSDLL